MKTGIQNTNTHNAEKFLLYARPVCFSNSHGEYPYTMRGTCFLIRYEGRIFGITAKHVIAGYKPSDVLIPYHAGAEMFLPISTAFGIKTDFEASKDHEEYAVFEIDLSELDQTHFKHDAVYDLGSFTLGCSHIDTLCVVTGFPSENNEIDYDRRVFSLEAKGLYALKTGHSRMVGCKELEFRNAAGLSSFDGFSGAPVFSLWQSRPDGRTDQLEGMLVRASSDTSKGLLGHYVDAVILKNILQHEIKASQS